MNSKIIFLVAVATMSKVGHGAPAGSDSLESNEAKYDFSWSMSDSPSSRADFGHQEARDGDNTQGSYFVQLPDTRLQTVTYYVDGDSGYVAEVQYQGEARYPDSAERSIEVPRFRASTKPRVNSQRSLNSVKASKPFTITHATRFPDSDESVEASHFKSPTIPHFRASSRSRFTSLESVEDRTISTPFATRHGARNTNSHKKSVEIPRFRASTGPRFASLESFEVPSHFTVPRGVSNKRDSNRRESNRKVSNPSRQRSLRTLGFSLDDTLERFDSLEDVHDFFTVPKNPFLRD